ncbi:MAG: hypothetical protein ABSD88_08710 [Candidatus Korobacteraceae bacterium]|jgi:hypothetical protein
MKRLVLAVVIAVLLLVMVAPEVAKTYAQELGWLKFFTSGSFGATLADKLGGVRELLSGEKHGAAMTGEISPGSSGGASSGMPSAPAAASSSQRHELTDWEKAHPRGGKLQHGNSQAVDKAATVVLVRTVPSAPGYPPAPEASHPPTLSANTVVISGELVDPVSDSVADAARRYRRKAQPQPGQAPAR